MAKILVIDDERSIRNSMKDILTFEKHEGLVAESGMEGLVGVRGERREWVVGEGHACCHDFRPRHYRYSH